MKKSMFFIAALAALVSCVKETPVVDTPTEENPNVTLEEVTIHAVSAETKTQLGEDGRNVQWSAGDVVKVCMPANTTGYDSNKIYRGTSATFESQGKDGDENVVFKGMWDTSADCASEGFVVYPESVSFESRRDGGVANPTNTISYSIATVQEAKEGTFDKNLNLSYAPVTKAALEANNAQVTFMNACALFEIILPETDYHIKSIRIEQQTPNGTSFTGYEALTWTGSELKLEKTGSSGRDYSGEDYVLLQKTDGSDLVPGAKYYAVVWAAMYSQLKFTFTNAEGEIAEKNVSGNYSTWFNCAAGVCEKFHFKSALEFAAAPVLELDVESFDATWAEASKTVNVTANNSWTASSNASWLILSATSGTDNGSFTMTAAENTTLESRTATVTVKSAELTETITVTQTQKKWYVVSQIDAATELENGASYVIAGYSTYSNYFWQVESDGNLKMTSADKDNGFTEDYVINFETHNSYSVSSPWGSYNAAKTGFLRSEYNDMYLEYYNTNFNLSTILGTNDGKYFCPIIFCNKYSTDPQTNKDIDFYVYWGYYLYYYPAYNHMYWGDNTQSNRKWYMYKVELR